MRALTTAVEPLPPLLLLPQKTRLEMIMRREIRCSHNFVKKPTFGLSGKDEFWDFSSLVDKKKRAVFIGIQLLPQQCHQE